MAMIEFLDQNQSQNPIAEKFQSLIVGVLGRGGTRMGERHGEEAHIAEMIPDSVLNDGRRVGFQATSQVNEPG